MAEHILLTMYFSKPISWNLVSIRWQASSTDLCLERVQFFSSSLACSTSATLCLFFFGSLCISHLTLHKWRSVPSKSCTMRTGMCGLIQLSPSQCPAIPLRIFVEALGTEPRFGLFKKTESSDKPLRNKQSAARILFTKLLATIQKTTKLHKLIYQMNIKGWLDSIEPNFFSCSSFLESTKS